MNRRRELLAVLGASPQHGLKVPCAISADRVIEVTIRRDLLIVLGAIALAPRAVFAQLKQPVVIGWLHSASRKTNEHSFAAFKEGMAELGWKEGSNFVLEVRWANGRIDGLPALARELAAKKPAVIVAGQSVAVAAASKAAPGIPIVAAQGDPVGAGLVGNLARPESNITGVTNVSAQVHEKYPELLIAAVPTLRRIGFLSDSGSSNRASYVEIARRSTARHGIEALFADAARPEEIAPAIAQLVKERAQALVLLPNSFFASERQAIVKLALANRWPMISGARPWAEAGALLTYGPDPNALHRRAAYYVDRILKGAKPADLPIEQPPKFELVVNMKTAKALGLTIPQPFLMRADKVIE